MQKALDNAFRSATLLRVTIWLPAYIAMTGPLPLSSKWLSIRRAGKESVDIDLPADQVRPSAAIEAANESAGVDCPAILGREQRA